MQGVDVGEGQVYSVMALQMRPHESQLTGKYEKYFSLSPEDLERTLAFKVRGGRLEKEKAWQGMEGGRGFGRGGSGCGSESVARGEGKRSQFRCHFRRHISFSDSDIIALTHTTGGGGADVGGVCVAVLELCRSVTDPDEDRILWSSDGLRRETLPFRRRSHREDRNRMFFLIAAKCKEQMGKHPLTHL